MIRSANTRRWVGLSLVLAVAAALVVPTHAQDRPRSGGELVFVVAAEPPSFDG
jgi:hypothetical protein